MNIRIFKRLLHAIVKERLIKHQAASLARQTLQGWMQVPKIIMRLVHVHPIHTSHVLTTLTFYQSTIRLAGLPQGLTSTHSLSHIKISFCGLIWTHQSLYYVQTMVKANLKPIEGRVWAMRVKEAKCHHEEAARI